MRNDATNQLTTRCDVRGFYGDLSMTLSASRNAIAAKCDRAQRRLVLTLTALMVAAGATVVLLAWSVS